MIGATMGIAIPGALFTAFAGQNAQAENFLPDYVLDGLGHVLREEITVNKLPTLTLPTRNRSIT